MKKTIMTLSAIAAFLTSCAPSVSLSGEWTVLTIKGEGVSAAIVAPQIIIDGDSYSGQTGVNCINGKLTLKGDSISFGEAAMTRMMGDPASMDVEQRYMDAINAAAKATVKDSDMILSDKDGNELMTLTKK